MKTIPTSKSEGKISVEICQKYLGSGAHSSHDKMLTTLPNIPARIAIDWKQREKRIPM